MARVLTQGVGNDVNLFTPGGITASPHPATRQDEEKLRTLGSATQLFNNPMVGVLANLVGRAGSKIGTAAQNQPGPSDGRYADEVYRAPNGLADLHTAAAQNISRNMTPTQPQAPVAQPTAQPVARAPVAQPTNQAPDGVNQFPQQRGTLPGVTDIGKPNPVIPPAGEYERKRLEHLALELQTADGKDAARIKAEMAHTLGRISLHDEQEKGKAPSAEDTRQFVAQQGNRVNFATTQQRERDAFQEDQLQVKMVPTRGGSLPVVNLGDGRAVVQDPRTKDFLIISADNQGQPRVEQRISEADGARMMQRPAEPAPEAPQVAPPQAPAALVEPAKSAEASQVPAGTQSWYQSPGQAEQARKNSLETPRPGKMDQAQLLAEAAAADTPEKRKEVMARAGDVDVWGTSLAEVLTGSPAARKDFTAQLLHAMPPVNKGFAGRAAKTQEELGLITAKTETEKSKKKWYDTKPADIEADNQLARDRLVEQNRHQTTTELENAHKNTMADIAKNAKLIADKAHHDTQDELGKLKLGEVIREFDKKDRQGYYRPRPGMTIQVINQQLKGLDLMGETADKGVRLVEDRIKDARKVQVDNAGDVGVLKLENDPPPLDPQTLKRLPPDAQVELRKQHAAEVDKIAARNKDRTDDYTARLAKKAKSDAARAVADALETSPDYLAAKKLRDEVVEKARALSTPRSKTVKKHPR